MLLKGQARDTGYRIYETFRGQTKYASEQLEFLVRLEHIELTTKFLMYFPLPIRWWIKKCAWVPDPATVGKKSFLKPKVGKIYYRLGWDEFLWKGEPFGFHFRRVARAHRPLNPAKYGAEAEELILLGKVFERTGMEGLVNAPL